jgi:hypothetical protein
MDLLLVGASSLAVRTGMNIAYFIAESPLW